MKKKNQQKGVRGGVRPRAHPFAVIYSLGYVCNLFYNTRKSIAN